MRFETPLSLDDLSKVSGMFVSLTPQQRCTLNYKINLIDEKQMEVFHDELLSEHTAGLILLE